MRRSMVKLTLFRGADYADESNDKRSVSGTVVILVGAAVGWASSTQRCVKLSATEAEYVALDEGVKEALFTGHGVIVYLPRAKRIMHSGF